MNFHLYTCGFWSFAIGRLFCIVNSKIFCFSSNFNLYLVLEMLSNYLIKIFDTVTGLFKNKDNIKMKSVN